MWTEASSDIIKNGFKKAGILPFDNSVISEENYNPASLERWRKAKNEPNKQPPQDEPEQQPPQVNHEQQSPQEEPEQQPFFQDKPEQQPPHEKPSKQKFNSDEEAPMQVTGAQLRSQPSTSKADPESNNSLESLFLKAINKATSENCLIRKPKRKVCSGAEVITSKEMIQRLEELDELKKSKKKKKPLVVQEVTSDEDEDEVLIESEEEVNLNFFQEFEEMEQDLENMTKQIGDIAVNDWVLVKFPGKKCIKHYVGQIINISDVEYKEKFFS